MNGSIQKGEYVVYGKVGVCRVVDRQQMSFGAGGGGEYYVLAPESDPHSSVYVPCGNRTLMERLRPLMTQQEIEDMLAKIVADSGEEGITYDMHWKSEGNYTDEDAVIVQTVKKNAEAVWGHEVVPAYQWASSDARDYRRVGVPTIQYGPSNTEGIHSYNENVDIEDVVNAGQIYVLSLCDMLGVE